MRANSISSQIKTQKIRMFVIYGALVILGTWQWHFVVEGVGHNVYLNGMIFGVFGFGSILAFRDLFAMKNEQYAFEALQEAYQDIQKNKQRSQEDPFWRHYRCLEKGIVFENPKLLGHIYDIIVEELHRTKHMRISVTTMQNLTTALAHLSAQSRSLLQYMSGLLVFLGLIGTFIGLMEMVGSVGGIIGGLANADAGSGDAMKKLLQDLQAPLTGMATGFAASLFGLFTSLVLGLVNRFVASAAHAVTAEFEGWLAGIAQIENERKNAEGVAQEDSTFMAAPGVAAIITALRSTNHTFEKTAEAVLKLADRRKEENEALVAATAQIERLTVEQDSMRRAITSLGGIRDDINGLRQLDYAQANRVVEGFAKLEGAIEESRAATMRGFEDASQHQSEAIKQTHVATETLSRKIDEIAAQSGQSHLDSVDRLESLAQLQASLTRLLQTSQGQTVAKLDDLSSSLDRLHIVNVDQAQSLAVVKADLGAGIRELTMRPDTSPQIQHMSATLDSTMVRGLGEVAQVLNTALGVVTSSMKQIAEKQSEANTILNAVSETQQLAQEIRQLGKSIDGGLSNGFAEMSRSFESVFMSYSELLNRGGSTQDVVRANVPANATHRVEIPLVDPDSQAARQAQQAQQVHQENQVRKNLEKVEQFYSSAQSRLSDLLKSA